MNDPEVEELLEQLYVAQVEDGRDLSEELPEGPAQAASQLGYLQLRNGAHTLTDSGVAAARDVVRRHRLAERLLRDVLAVGPDQMEQGACEFEHILQRGLDEKICILLGHPSTCPHGKSIPQGRCCLDAEQADLKQVSPLCDVSPERDGVVAYLSTRDQQEIQKLMAMGVLPGVRIRLLRRFPSYVFQVGFSQFTVDRSLAEKIYVHWREPEDPRDRRFRLRRRRGQRER